MSFLGIKVPHEITRLLSGIDIPGDKVSRDEMHITLLYVGKQTPIEHLVRVIMAAFRVTSQTQPFAVETRQVTSFSPNPDDGVPIIARIESPPLHDLRNALCRAFDAEKVEYSKKYPDYKPHVTLGYSQDDAVFSEMVADKDIPVVEWGVGEIVLWGGDSGDEKLTVTFPLSMNRAGVKTASDWQKDAYRAIIRLSSALKAHDENGHCADECQCHGDPLVHKVVARFRKEARV
jgi:2'-5' RNA ligase